MLSTSLHMELRKISRGIVLGVNDKLTGIKAGSQFFSFLKSELKEKKNLKNKLQPPCDYLKAPRRV